MPTTMVFFIMLPSEIERVLMTIPGLPLLKINALKKSYSYFFYIPYEMPNFTILTKQRKLCKYILKELNYLQFFNSTYVIDDTSKMFLLFFISYDNYLFQKGEF